MEGQVKKLKSSHQVQPKEGAGLLDNFKVASVLLGAGRGERRGIHSPGDRGGAHRFRWRGARDRLWPRPSASQRHSTRRRRRDAADGPAAASTNGVKSRRRHRVRRWLDDGLGGRLVEERRHRRLAPSVPTLPGLLDDGGGLVPAPLSHPLELLPRALAQEDVLPAVGPRGVARDRDARRILVDGGRRPFLQFLAVTVEDGLAVVDGLLVGAAERPVRPPHDGPVARVERLEAHPVRKPARHDVDRLEDLQRADLLDDEVAVELGERVVLVGPEAADEVRLGVDQRAEEVVESRVEVLRERRDGLVTEHELRGRRGRDAEGGAFGSARLRTTATATLGRRRGRQGLDLVAEEVGGEAEIARVAVEDGDEIIGDDVPIRV